MPPNDVSLSSQTIERWSLRLSLSQPLSHVEHAGSMLRGAFGHALKALACACGGEPHVLGCRYQQIFEPLPPLDWPSRYRDCPPAYVLSPPAPESSSRTHLDFAFTLLGPSLTQRALIWEAWQHAAQQGLGNRRISARLQAVAHSTQPTAMLASRQVRLQLTSPLLLKRKQVGQSRSEPIGPCALCVSDLLIALHRRLTLTHGLYGVPASPLPPLEQWLALGDSLDLQACLLETHFSRHSNRQQQRMPLYGLSGTIDLRGPLDPTLLAALTLGQWLHIGGKTALGLGGYKLQGPAAPAMRLTLEDSF